MRVSSIISCVSKKMDSLASLYGMSSGLNDVNCVVGDVVKIKEDWGSYGEERSYGFEFVSAHEVKTLLCRGYSLVSSTMLATVVRRRGKFDDCIPKSSSTSPVPRR